MATNPTQRVVQSWQAERLQHAGTIPSRYRITPEVVERFLIREAMPRAC